MSSSQNNSKKSHKQNNNNKRPSLDRVVSSPPQTAGPSATLSAHHPSLAAMMIKSQLGLSSENGSSSNNNNLSPLILNSSGKLNKQNCFCITLSLHAWHSISWCAMETKSLFIWIYCMKSYNSSWEENCVLQRLLLEGVTRLFRKKYLSHKEICFPDD